MGNEKGSKFQQGTSTWEAEVKPQGHGARTDFPTAKPQPERPMFGETLMEEVCERSNLRAALQRVRANRGSPGVDNMTVEELPSFPKEHWPAIKARLLKGEYHYGGEHPNRRKIAPAALVRFKAQVRRLTRRSWGLSLPERIQRLARYLKGWREYYG